MPSTCLHVSPPLIPLFPSDLRSTVVSSEDDGGSRVCVCLSASPHPPAPPLSNCQRLFTANWKTRKVPVRASSRPAGFKRPPSQIAQLRLERGIFSRWAGPRCRASPTLSASPPRSGPCVWLSPRIHVRGAVLGPDGCEEGKAVFLSAPILRVTGAAELP